MRIPAPSTAAVVVLAVAPLALVPGGFERFVLPKLMLAVVAIGLGSLAPARGRLARPVVVVGAATVALLLVAAVASTAPLAAALGRYPRYEGLPVWLVYAGCAWLGARLLPDHRTRAALETALACASLLEAAVCLLQLVGHSPLATGGVRRPGALLGNATDQGLLAVVMVAVLLPAALRARRPLVVAGLIGALLAAVASGSRGALTALAVVLVGQALARRETRRWVAAGAGVAVLLALALPSTRERLLATHTVGGRWLLWGETLRLVRDHPLLGVGPSGFFEAIRRYHDLAWADRVGAANPPDSPHLWLLQVAAAAGVPGLLCALAMIAVVARLAVRAVRRDAWLLGPATAGAGYAVGLLTHFTSAGTTPLAAFLLGGVVSVQATVPAARERAVALAVRTVATLGVLVLVAGAVGEVVLARAVQGRAGFDAAQSWRPWDVDLPVFAAQTLAVRANQGDEQAVGAAEHWARKALGVVPNSVDARVALAVSLLQQDRLAGARAELDRLVVAAPTEPQVFLERGIARFGEGDVAGSLTDLERAHELDPRDATVARVLAEIRARVK